MEYGVVVEGCFRCFGRMNFSFFSLLFFLAIWGSKSLEDGECSC